MAWEPLITLTPRQRSQRKTCDDDSIRITRQQSKSQPQAALAFVIGEKVCKELRWQIGDTVTVSRDENGLLGLSRVSNGGNVLTCSSKTGPGMSKRMAGKISRAAVRFKCDEEVISKFVAKDSVRIIEKPLCDGSTLIIGEPL
jgi:hypothetical protein